MKNRKIMLALVCALVFAFTTSMAIAHGGDIGLYVENDKIHTGFINHDEELIEGVRVFGSDLSEFLGQWKTHNPGFDAESNTFPTGSMMIFNIITALKKWNGSGFDVADGFMNIAHSHSAQDVNTSTGFMSGFSLPVAVNGHWHAHYHFTLFGEAYGVPADGIYLLELNMVNSDPSLTASDSFWIVFNKNMDEEDHELAVHWVEDNMVPEPATFAVLASGVLGIAGFMRRKK